MVVRFIEFMPLEEDRVWSPDIVVPLEEILARMAEFMPLREIKRGDSETARRYVFEDGVGEIGIIAPVSHPFCGHCSRVRITSDGKIRTCLFSVLEHDLALRMAARRIRRGARSSSSATWSIRKKSATTSVSRALFPPRGRWCISAAKSISSAHFSLPVAGELASQCVRTTSQGDTGMHGALQDIRFAVRQLRKSPGFAAVAILTLALGIGASTIIFSVVYNGVLYPFPYRSAERLTAISIQDLERGDRGLRGMFHLDEVAAFRNGNHSFEDILAYGVYPSMVYIRRNSSEMLNGGRRNS